MHGVKNDRMPDNSAVRELMSIAAGLVGFMSGILWMLR